MMNGQESIVDTNPSPFRVAPSETKNIERRSKRLKQCSESRTQWIINLQNVSMEC